jgi:hypothetical protein
MKKILTAVLLVNIFIMTAHAQVHRFDPPWNTPPASAVPFTVPDVDWSGSGSTFYTSECKAISVQDSSLSFSITP